MKGVPLFIAAMALVAAITAMSARGDDVPDVVRCRLPNGSLYFGAAPPENCIPVARERSARARPTPDMSNQDHPGRQGRTGTTADVPIER